MAEARAKRWIGLCGRAGAGKDAAAALLVMVGYRRIGFADAVRDEVRTALARGRIPAAAHNEIAGDMRAATVLEVDAKPTSMRMRRILQWWGTDYRRAQDADYWVRQAIEEALLEERDVVFSDVRFPNEAAAIREHGGVIWRISGREAIGVPSHESEWASKHIVADKYIGNTGTMADLAANLADALREFERNGENK